MTSRIKHSYQLKRDTAADWASANPVLAHGEPGIEGTPGVLMDRMKMGDGVTRWNDLPYMAATDTGANGVVSPTLSSIVVLTEAAFADLLVKNPTTVYLVLPNAAP